MANEEQNQNLQLVPFVSTNQDQQHVDQKQVLSASLFKKIDQSYAPQYRFVQQPMRILMPFNPMDHQNHLSDPNSDPLEITNEKYGENKHMKNPEHINQLAIVPSSHNEVSAEIQPSMNNEIVLWQGGGVAHQITNASEVLSQLPYSKRKENWIARRVPRSNESRSDLQYVHLQTNKQFRSLVEVHNFVVHGRLPKRPAKVKKDENAAKLSNETSPRRVKGPRGDKLLNRVPVGYYDLTTGEIFRGEMPPAGALGYASTNKRKKRKREDDTPAEEMAVVIWTAQGTPQHDNYILYDIEPKN